MPLQRVDDALSEGDDALTGCVIGRFYHVYNRLRFGFAESVYSGAMFVELTRAGLHVIREAPLEIVYDGAVVGQFRVDLLVNDRLILELKSAPRLTEADESQLVNYLRIANFPFGLLLHFGPRPLVRRVLRPRG
jgi:GxxExxY protein